MMCTVSWKSQIEGIPSAGYITYPQKVVLCNFLGDTVAAFNQMQYILCVTNYKQYQEC